MVDPERFLQWARKMETVPGESVPLPPSFADILRELQALHDKKSADYGTGDDPLANIRESEKYGIPAWLGAVIRGGDKVKRIQTFAKKGKLENESVEDSIRDLAVYAIIALQLYREREFHSANPA